MVCAPCQFKAEHYCRMPCIVLACDVDPHIAFRAGLSAVIYDFGSCLIALVVLRVHDVGNEMVVYRHQTESQSIDIAYDSLL